MMTITGGTPDFDLLTPLDTDADVLDRVDQLIGEDARRDRSLWLLFLDADAVQLPVVVPIDDGLVDDDPIPKSHSSATRDQLGGNHESRNQTCVERTNVADCIPDRLGFGLR